MIQQDWLNWLISSLVISLIFGGIVYLLMRSEEKKWKKEKILIEECESYLNTVKKRAYLSVSTEALDLLLDEMISSCDNLKYNKENYHKYMKIVEYIKGKYDGLLKRSIKI